MVFLKGVHSRGAWVAQLVKRPTSAQAMISQFTGSTSALGSVLTAQSPEPALDSVSVSRNKHLSFFFSFLKIKGVNSRLVGVSPF